MLRRRFTVRSRLSPRASLSFSAAGCACEDSLGCSTGILVAGQSSSEGGGRIEGLGAETSTIVGSGGGGAPVRNPISGRAKASTTCRCPVIFGEDNSPAHMTCPDNFALYSRLRIAG